MNSAGVAGGVHKSCCDHSASATAVSPGAPVCIGQVTGICCSEIKGLGPVDKYDAMREIQSAFTSREENDTNEKLQQLYLKLAGLDPARAVFLLRARIDAELKKDNAALGNVAKAETSVMAFFDIPALG